MKFSASVIISLAFLFVVSTAECPTDCPDACDPSNFYCCDALPFCCPTENVDTGCALNGCSVNDEATCVSGEPVGCSYENPPACADDLCVGLGTGQLASCPYRCTEAENDACPFVPAEFCEPEICVAGTDCAFSVTDPGDCQTVHKREFNATRCECGCSANSDCDEAGCEKCVDGLCKIQVTDSGNPEVPLETLTCPDGSPSTGCKCGCQVDTDCLDVDGVTCPFCNATAQCDDRNCPTSKPCCKVTSGNDLVCANGCGKNNICFDNLVNQGEGPSCDKPGTVCDKNCPTGGCDICRTNDRTCDGDKYDPFQTCIDEINKP